MPRESLRSARREATARTCSQHLHLPMESWFQIDSYVYLVLKKNIYSKIYVLDELKMALTFREQVESGDDGHGIKHAGRSCPAGHLLTLPRRGEHVSRVEESTPAHHHHRASHLVPPRLSLQHQKLPKLFLPPEGSFTWTVNHSRCLQSDRSIARLSHGGVGVAFYKR